MALSPHVAFCLSEALNRLREAAEFSSEPAADEINELADEVEAIKEWGEEKQK